MRMMEPRLMGIWLILAVMTALAVGLALYPLVRSPRTSASRREHNLTVYRAQLEELQQERERGLLGPKEAQAAELEIKRRMLAADADEKAGRGPVSSGAAKGMALFVAIGLPLLSLAVYGQLGAPHQPSSPFAEREARQLQVAEQQAGAGAAVPPVETLIARLEERVEAAPEDLEAWVRLAQAYVLVERHGAAARAYRAALAIHDGLPSLHAALGEALMMAAGGTVTEPARDAFALALALDPEEPRARFYQGLALAQRGEREEALETWRALLADSPADAPWIPALRAQIAELAGALGRDPGEILAQAEPPATGVENSGADSPLERQARALRLEAQLENDPKDWQGWIELARLWGGLGQAERARAALERGGSAYAEAPFVQQQFRQAAAELGLAADAPQRGPSAAQVEQAQALSAEEQQEMIRGMVEGLAARLEQAPDDPQGWRMLGRSYLVLGEPERSAQAYAQLAALMPQDVEAQLEYAQALLQLGAEEEPLAPELVEQMERVLALDDDHPAALFYLGRAAHERGEPAQAVRYWERLLAELPPGSSDRQQIQQLIEQIGASN